MASEPDDAETAGQRADPVAAKSEDPAEQAGPAYGSGDATGQGDAAPSGNRASGPPSAKVPLVHTAMDAEVRDAEEKAGKMSAP